MPKPRIIMLGTGDFALPTFLHLVEGGENDVIALITQPDRPQGRKQELIPSPVKQAALAKGITVYQPESVNAPQAVAWIAEQKPDFLVAAAYGQILSRELLAVPKKSAINLHGSLLPSYRGAAPVARAIERGETIAGVTVIEMSPRVDAGGMMKLAETPIGPDETAGELETRLAALGAPLVSEVLGEIQRGEAMILPQAKTKVTQAPKLKKEDGLIAWSKSSQAIHDLVRAMQPWPQASTTWKPAKSPEAARLIIHRTKMIDRASTEPPGTILEARGNDLIVATGDGSLSIVTLQLVGRKALGAAEFLRGNAIKAGDRFGSSD